MIIVIPFSSADAQRAERLCDLIYWLNDKKQLPACVLVNGSEVHAENRQKTKIAAEVAFATVEMLELPSVENLNKIQQINRAFSRASRYIFDCYRQPWLWLESDCVPLRKSWLAELVEAYESQPKRYIGRFMQGKNHPFLSRTSVYPPNASADLEKFCVSANGPALAPFEQIGSTTQRSTLTRLIHIEKWRPELAIPESACLINGDRSGKLIESIMGELPPGKNGVVKQAQGNRRSRT